LGSAGGNTETLLEVGFDPATKKLLDSLHAESAEYTAQFDELQLNLQTLENLKLERGELSEEKEAYLMELYERRRLIASEMTSKNEEIGAAKAKLESLKNIGRVNTSGKVYAGVVVTIRDQRETVNSEYKGVSFKLEEGLIRVRKYDASSDVELKPGR
jgi:uncharacterized protein (DUF342 family)